MKKFLGKMEKWLVNVAEWIVIIIIAGICIGLFLMLFSFGITGMYLMFKTVYNFWIN